MPVQPTKNVPGRSGSPLALATYEMGQTLAARRLRERCRAPCLFHLLVINQLRSTSDIQDVRRRTCAKDAAGATSCLQSLAKLTCSCVNVWQLRQTLSDIWLFDKCARGRVRKDNWTVDGCVETGANGGCQKNGLTESHPCL